MDRVQTYVDDQLVLPEELNGIQDTAAGLAQLHGLQVSGPPYITNYGGNLSVGAHSVVLGGKAFDVATNNAVSVAAGSADSWFAILEHNNAGTHAFEVASAILTAGDARYDTTRRYLGAIHYNALGNPLEFRKTGRRFMYRTIDSTVQILTSGAATSATNLAWAGRVPDHVRMVLLEAQFTVLAANAAANWALLDGVIRLQVAAQAVDRTARGQFWVPRDDSGNVKYQLNSATSSSLNVWVVGYEDAG